MLPNSLVRVQATAAAMLACAFATASAQTRFEWPDTAVDVAHYQTVDQCLAATERVRRGVMLGTYRAGLASGVWEDTMLVDKESAMQAAPPTVVETARRCSARFPVKTADVSDFAPLLKLYLAASRDDDASALVAKRFDAIPSAASRQVRTSAADSAVVIYLAARPARPAAAERILLNRNRARADRIESLSIYYELMRAAKLVDDSARVRQGAELLVAVADSLTPAERQSSRYEEMYDGTGGDELIYEALNALTGQRVALDSLRRGTPAFVTLMHAQWSKATGERFEALRLPVGMHAPDIVADAWLPASAGTSPRPTPGHASLIYFLDHEECLFYGDDEGSTQVLGCPTEFAMLHRLAKQYPSLEITIVTKTSGAFVYEAPPSAAEEVEWIRKWTEARDAPGAVAVSFAPFLRLPAPDGRRVNRDAPNSLRYSFGKNWKVNSGTWFLADQGGTIVAFMGDEHDLSQYIDVLVSRHPGAEK